VEAPTTFRWMKGSRMKPRWKRGAGVSTHVRTTGNGPSRFNGGVDDRIGGEYAAAEKSELYLALTRHLTTGKIIGNYKADARRLG
jgi:hypothetical protein